MEKVNTRIYQEKEVERTRERERALVEGGGCDPLQLNALDAALRKVNFANELGPITPKYL